MTNQGTKRTAKGKQPTVKKQPSTQLINQLINPVCNHRTLKEPASLARPKNLTQPPANYQNIPQVTQQKKQIFHKTTLLLSDGGPPLLRNVSDLVTLHDCPNLFKGQQWFG